MKDAQTYLRGDVMCILGCGLLCWLRTFYCPGFICCVQAVRQFQNPNTHPKELHVKNTVNDKRCNSRVCSCRAGDETCQGRKRGRMTRPISRSAGNASQTGISRHILFLCRVYLNKSISHRDTLVLAPPHDLPGEGLNQVMMPNSYCCMS